MAAAGEKLAAELAELDAELLRLTSENNASGARRDILRAEDVYKRQVLSVLARRMASISS